MNLGKIKMKLLREGVTFNENSLSEVEKKYTERVLAYNCGDEDLGKIKKIPAIILLDENIVVTTRYRKRSPWNIKKIGNNYKLFFKNKEIVNVSFAKRPKFYDLKLKNGTLVKNIITQYCAYNLGIFVRRDCFYWKKGKQCKFCSIGINSSLNKEYDKKLDVSQIKEGLRIALKNCEKIKNIEWGGGNLENNDEGIKEIVGIIEECKEVTKGYSQHLCIMPPNDLDLLKKIKEAGIERITFSLEIFDPEIFKEICPGKADSGRDKFIKALEYAVNIFGKGNVSCNLIAGLEPLESVKKAYLYFFKKGIIPSVPIFHPDKGTPLENKSPPSEEFLLNIAKTLNSLYKKYKYEPILHNARGASIDSEIYEGYFNEI